MQKYGVFISHKSEDWALAGRIYDYLQAYGVCPFLDVVSLRQGKYEAYLKQQVQSAPYFLLLLTGNSLKNNGDDSWVIKEIRWAAENPQDFLIITTKDFIVPEGLPQDIKEILDSWHHYMLERENFFDVMNRLVSVDIKWERIQGIADWKTKAGFLAKTFVGSREDVEKCIATLEHRFGEELVKCVKEKREFTGQNRVKSIHMSCYAASLVFAPQINMVDERAFDRGILFDIFAELLKDDEFSLEIIITAPMSAAAVEAAENEKLGNGRLEAYPQAIFLSSYCNIFRLIEQDPIFKKAKIDRRFRFMVTEMFLPYAIFQVNYKENFDTDDHIKVDLYSENLTSNMDRRSMLFFKETDPQNYAFFDSRYKRLRNMKESARLIQENHAVWLEEWERLKEEIGYEE